MTLSASRSVRKPIVPSRVFCPIGVDAFGCGQNPLWLHVFAALPGNPPGGTPYTLTRN